MILSQSLLSELLGIGLSSGADFAEVFAENTLESQMTLTGGSVESIADRKLSGMGFRLLKGTKSVYASTSDMSRSGLISCARSAAEALGSLGEAGHVVLCERIFPDIHGIRIVPSTAAAADKAALLHRAYDSAKAYSKEIVQAQARFLDIDRNILIANSEGLLTQDRQIRTRLSINAVASNGSENQSGSSAPGARMGMELYDMKTPEDAGTEAARQAVTMLHAGYAPAGNMAVAIENGFGGVIFHEACGHSLEATSVAPGNSEFSGKLGQKIASDRVTAIDDGTIPNAWGSENIDDEGNEPTKLVLIENGILKNYMIDRLNSRKMGMPVTGSGRRQGYMFAPTSRMRNTYIAAGNDSETEMIATMGDGLYCRKMGGGSVDPSTGKFNFAVQEGYLVKDGRIIHPVRGASLIGRGSEILMKIDRVGRDMQMAQGMCGSLSGSVPTNVGQPMIRVSSLTVGGAK